MPSKGDTQINNFVGGLITEASPLSFPPNASFDEINFKLNRDGTRERRLGLDIEEGGEETDIGLTASQLTRARHTFFDWPSPNGSVLIHIGVIQAGNQLYFMNLVNQAPSATLLNGGSPLVLAMDVDGELAYALHNNALIVVSEAFENILFVSYDEETDTISSSTQDLQIRDFYGVDDSHADSSRPATLTDKHHYNLLNQGWTGNIQTTCTISGEQAIGCTKEKLGVYPSNQDQWSLGKIQDQTDALIDRYDPATLQRNSINLGRAARGHFIISPYSRGFSRNSQTGLNLIIDRELGRIKTVTSYAGRICYAGIRSRTSNGDAESPRMSGMVFFSQVAASTRDAAKCYQVADPTSAEDSAIADTDGGVIQITEAVGIIKLLAVKDSLFVFARNGVWQIRGDDGGFRATSFQVKKISNAGTISTYSIVEANGTIFYWGEGGIFSLVLDQLGENYETKNVTQPTVQKYFNSLPDLTKQTAKGIYDMKENQIRWLFKSDFPKIIGDPIDIHPFVPTIGVGTSAEMATGIEPKIVKISTNTAMIGYRSAFASSIGVKLVTADPETYVITKSAETIVVTGTAIAGISLLQLTTDRVLLTWAEGTVIKAVVLHVIGGNVFLTATTTIATAHAVAAGTGPIRAEIVSGTNTVIVSYIDVTTKNALQILQIDASFNITFGTKALSTSTTIRPDVVMLDSTNGVLMSSGANRVNLETFTVSGTTITVSGVDNVFINTTQIPLPTTFASSTHSLARASNTSVYLTGIVTTLTPAITSAPYHWLCTVAGSAVTSTDILQQDTEKGLQPFTETIDGKAVTIFRQDVGGVLSGRMVVNTLANPPVEELQLDFGASTTYSFPELASVAGGLIIVLYEGATQVEAIAGRVVL